MYVCRRVKLCGFLIGKGFQYLFSRPDRKNKDYSVWLFEDTPELRAAIEEYYA